MPVGAGRCQVRGVRDAAPVADLVAKALGVMPGAAWRRGAGSASSHVGRLAAPGTARRRRTHNHRGLRGPAFLGKLAAFTVMSQWLPPLTFGAGKSTSERLGSRPL
jgi:hypothetical protein